jgi:ribosomal protein L16 Arg81 hydroxylase
MSKKTENEITKEMMDKMMNMIEEYMKKRRIDEVLREKERVMTDG